MTDRQWPSIRDDAFIDVEEIISKYVGDKIPAADRWKLAHEFLDLADRLSRQNASDRIDQLGEALRQTMVRYRLKLPRARRREEPPEARRDGPF